MAVSFERAKVLMTDGSTSAQLGLPIETILPPKRLKLCFTCPDPSFFSASKKLISINKNDKHLKI